MTKLKVGVAGAGVFGNYHAQKAAASARTEFMGVYDIDQDRAERVASTFGARGTSDYRAFLDMCDAIVIAVPATFHEPLAREAIEAHCHVLVEKRYQGRRHVVSQTKPPRVGVSSRSAIRNAS